MGGNGALDLHNIVYGAALPVVFYFVWLLIAAGGVTSNITIGRCGFLYTLTQ